MWLNDEAQVRWYKDLYAKSVWENDTLKREIKSLQEELKSTQEELAYYKRHTPDIMGNIWEEPKVYPSETREALVPVAFSQVLEDTSTNAYHIVIKSSTDIPNKNEVKFSYFMSKGLALTKDRVASILTILHKKAMDEVAKQLFM